MSVLFLLRKRLLLRLFIQLSPISVNLFNQYTFFFHGFSGSMIYSIMYEVFRPPPFRISHCNIVLPSFAASMIYFTDFSHKVWNCSHFSWQNLQLLVSFFAWVITLYASNKSFRSRNFGSSIRLWNLCFIREYQPRQNVTSNSTFPPLSLSVAIISLSLLFTGNTIFHDFFDFFVSNSLSLISHLLTLILHLLRSILYSSITNL